MGNLFWLLLLSIHINSPCEDSLSQLRRTPLVKHNQFHKLSESDQQDLLGLFKLPEEQTALLDHNFWKGFLFIQERIGIDKIESLLTQWRDPQTSHRKRKKLRREHPFLRLHPAVVIPFSQSVGSLLTEALNSKKEFTLDSLNFAFEGIEQALTAKAGPIYTNGFMGLIEEFRAAAYFVGQGYSLVDMRFEYQYENEDPARRSEIDLILRDPKKPSHVILVEIKQSLSNHEAHSDQYRRYENLKTGEIDFAHQVIESWIFIMRRPPTQKQHADFKNRHPEIQIVMPPENLRTESVYPAIKFKSSKKH